MASFLTTPDGLRLWYGKYQPETPSKRSVFILAGITGINHEAERQVIDIFCTSSRVVIMHPRGTGHSEGKKGDIRDFSLFTNDYIQLVGQLTAEPEQRNFLFGHSMSAAMAMAVAEKAKNTAGVILVNPPFKMRRAKGMSPTLGQFLKYAFFMLFAPHKPIIDMGGDPSVIENEDDRMEAEERQGDPMLVRHFSLYCMLQARKLMNRMVEFASRAGYPLLLLYGDMDPIVDRSGVENIFQAWKRQDKQFVVVQGGPHGRRTVLLAASAIKNWLEAR